MLPTAAQWRRRRRRGAAVLDPSSKWTDGRDRREPVVPSRHFRLQNVTLRQPRECNFRGWRLKACLQVLQGSFAKGLLPAAAFAVANFPFCKEKPSVFSLPNLARS
jgi:hypothetical protein